MAIPKAEWIWMNGKLVPWDEAQVHVLSHAIHFGSSAYEGMRAYSTGRGPAIFRLEAHVDRLYNSCKVLYIEVPYSKHEFREAVRETVRTNQHKSCYIRPIIFGGYGEMDLFLTEENRIEVVVASWEREAYYGSEAHEQGVDVAVSSWRRPAPGTLPLMAKLGGHYISSQLAAREAQTSGEEPRQSVAPAAQQAADRGTNDESDPERSTDEAHGSSSTLPGAAVCDVGLSHRDRRPHHAPHQPR